MFELTRDTIQLVFTNKIWADPVMAYRQVAIGALGTALALIALAYSGLPIWLSAIICGFAGGYAMPYLFRDVKFQ
jgi:site-specific recombinase